MGSDPIRYRSADEDSGRWIGFPYRPGDIVISTRSKSGTTWMQMICALLVFRTTDLPRPLPELSPWLDWLGTTRDDVYLQLAAQHHRRFIKTHTPLDGLPLDARVTFIVVGRHPLDLAVSLYHQGDNIDRHRMAELTGAARPTNRADRPPLDDWLRAWIRWDGDRAEQLDSLPGVLWHLDDAWRRAGEGVGNVMLVHYQDLETDLPAEMGRLARTLGIDIDDDEIARLATAATFDAMRARAEELAPDQAGVLLDRRRFFRHGRSGAGAAPLGADDLAAYHRRVADLASPELLCWLHR